MLKKVIKARAKNVLFFFISSKQVRTTQPIMGLIYTKEEKI